ncbi:hypothetical protein ACQY0O_001844 [Thecaphora frezii]
MSSILPSPPTHPTATATATAAASVSLAQRCFYRLLLLIQYQARLPPRSPRFRWPSAPALLAIQPYLFRDLFHSHPIPVLSSSSSPHPPNLPNLAPSFPPARNKYERLFLKELTARLQDAVDAASNLLQNSGVDETEYPEVDGDLLERYAELMSYAPGGFGAPSTRAVTGDGASSMMPPEWQYVSYLWNTTDRLSKGLAAADAVSSRPSTPPAQDPDRSELLCGYASVMVREEGSAISKGTTGFKTWEACLRLACFLLARPELVVHDGCRVLELGSGAGLLGAVCAVEQARAIAAGQREASASASRPRTWLTDMPGQVLERLSETMQLNGLDEDSPARIHPLDWIEVQRQSNEFSRDAASVANRDADDDNDGTERDLLGFLKRVKPTLILAADVVYDPDLVSPLASTIRTALQCSDNGGATALVSSTIRNPDTYKAFRDALDSQGLHVEPIPIEQKYLEAEAEAGGVEPVPFFPSVHDPVCDGRVELLCIRLPIS